MERWFIGHFLVVGSIYLVGFSTAQQSMAHWMEGPIQLVNVTGASVGPNGTDSPFAHLPPAYSQWDAGDEAVFHCSTRGPPSGFRVSWESTAQVDIQTFGINATAMDEQQVAVYVSGNDSLVFRRLEKQHAGLYTCVIHDPQNNLTVTASMWLYVTDVSDVNFARRVLFGAGGAILVSLLLFLFHSFITRHDKKKPRTEFELDTHDGDIPLSTDPMLPSSSSL